MPTINGTVQAESSHGARSLLLFPIDLSPRFMIQMYELAQRFFSALWLTVFATMCNVATFALAYRYSPPVPGSFRDADFWLFLQSSIMQWFSLLIASSALWNKATLPTWSWLVPILTALICSVIAIPLYLHAPTAWSAFATTVGRAVQAFMTVQLAVVGQ